MINRRLALTLIAIPLFGASSTKTFSRDVQPILTARCITCHQPGAVAPMSFTTYNEVRPWSRAIREAVVSGTMPPWHAAPGTAHAFRNDRSLSQTEIDTIAQWVDQESPEGSPLRSATAVTKTDTEWRLGTPDVVIEIPGLHVPKSGAQPYTFLIAPVHIERDTWVRAAEFRIDQRAVVHHMNAFIREPGSSYLADFPRNQIFVPTVAERGRKRVDEAVFARRQLLLGYEPGYQPMPWLPGGAKLLKAGSDIVFEMHFSPNGKELVDHSELGLYFATEAPVNRVIAIDTLRDLDLQIPPGARDYLSQASMKLGTSVRLLSVQPHMHVRGRSMEVRAIYPDGRREILLSVPRYDFNWQTTYVLKEPLSLPAGTVLESVAGFDNSPNNSFNPDPGATVHWGDQTTDEMHIAFLELVIEANANPETILTVPPEMIK